MAKFFNPAETASIKTDNFFANGLSPKSNHVFLVRREARIRRRDRRAL